MPPQADPLDFDVRFNLSVLTYSASGGLLFDWPKSKQKSPSRIQTRPATAGLKHEFAK